VAAVARELGVGWGTVWRAVQEYGTPLVEDPHRLDDVTALGVDEHVWQHAGPKRRTRFATGIVDLTPGRRARPLNVVEGRTGKVYADWLAEREQEWRERIAVAALDPFRGYASALCTELPHAIRVLDAFHVVQLGNTAVDDVRRRVQREQLGHRGHKHDPLYRVRRLLRRGAETLTDKQRARLEAALQAGDPNWEVTIAWHCAQRLRAIYHAPTPAHGRVLAERLLELLPTCPIPRSPAWAAPCARGGPSCWPTSAPAAPPTDPPKR
jgi:transposase